MTRPLAPLVMGSAHDRGILQQAARQLGDFRAAFDARAISAHCSSDLLFGCIKRMLAGGVQCFSAGAGGAAHLQSQEAGGAERRNHSSLAGLT